MASVQSLAIVETYEDEMLAIDFRLEDLEEQISRLQQEKRKLVQQKNDIQSKIHNKKSEELAAFNWDSLEGFDWSDKVLDCMKTKFKLSKFRAHQLSTMNATMSAHDVMLIMPTGGGKSLCYQLPALISHGMTLVISPLVSLMEDQVMSLQDLNIPAKLLSAATTKAEQKYVYEQMLDKQGTLKLLYVTPEKLAKSKMFMSKLQKMYEQGRLSRLAIDEVHCCSQWGHDFRPDYKYLGILKNMFPNTPILGLTATSTVKITDDVQTILNINGCLVFRSSFNRHNLYYEVRNKPSDKTTCMDDIATMLESEFTGLSGIIYCLSIKDCEEMSVELQGRGLSVGCYHAQMDAKDRSAVHKAWISGAVKVVVATIAFGMGIDKPDVRFVIHHSFSKSIENYYQESGRAGRDDLPAKCIILYRFADIFRLSTMVFTDRTGLLNLYSIVSFCLGKQRCRRYVLASHFGEEWTAALCNCMCDVCRGKPLIKSVDVTDYCQHLYNILSAARDKDKKITALKLIDSWLMKSGGIKFPGQKATSLSRCSCEDIVAYLLTSGYLQEDFTYTAYTTISYISKGKRASEVSGGKKRITMDVASRKPTVTYSLTSELKSARSNTQVSDKAARSNTHVSEKAENSTHKSLNGESSRTLEKTTNGSDIRKDSPKKRNREDDVKVKKKKAKVIIIDDSDED